MLRLGRANHMYRRTCSILKLKRFYSTGSNHQDSPCKTQHQKSIDSIYAQFYSTIEPKDYARAMAAAEVGWMADWAKEKSKGNSKKEAAFLKKALHRRVREHEPIQYILGSQPFNGLDISCKAPIFVPRPETELWSGLIIEKAQLSQQSLRILDLCTGTGCIGLSFAKANPKWSVWCVDLDARACRLVAKNAQANGITNATILRGNLFDGLHQKGQTENFENFFDIIVSNPPYIWPEEYKQLPKTVRKFETALSLIGSKRAEGKNSRPIDCIEYYKEIIAKAPLYLRRAENAPFPSIVMELGSRSADILRLFDGRYGAVQINKDFAGKERYITANLA